MITDPFELCLMCCLIRGKILALKEWFEDNKYLLKCIEHKETEQQWIGFHLNFIVKSANDIVDDIKRVESSLLRFDNLNSFIHKLIKSEINYFTEEFNNSIQPKLANIYTIDLRHVGPGNEYDSTELKKLLISMNNNLKTTDQIKEVLDVQEEVVLNIEKTTRSALMNVKTGRRRIERAKEMQTKLNKWTLCCIIIALVVIAFVVNLFIYKFISSLF